VDWIYLDQDRGKWPARVNGKEPSGSTKHGEILSFSRITLLRGVS
jgi:hypothetical protein